MRTFRPEDKLIRSEKMLSTDLDQETVLMSVDAGAYYGMSGPARIIWEKLENSMTFNQLIELLVKEYDVSQETCEADLQGFLGEMENEGLLRVERA